MHRKVPALTVALSSLAIVGCGSSQTKTVTAAAAPLATSSSATSSSSSTTTSSTSQAMTQAVAGKAYQRDVAPANKALDKFQSEVSGSPTNSQIAQASKPAVTAISTANGSLLTLAQRYPAAATDIKSLVTADTALSGDLQVPQDLTGNQLTQDLSKVNAAVSIVHSDLGLPQRKA
jgi:hypothetical protein